MALCDQMLPETVAITVTNQDEKLRNRILERAVNCWLKAKCDNWRQTCKQTWQSRHHMRMAFHNQQWARKHSSGSCTHAITCKCARTLGSISFPTRPPCSVVQLSPAGRVHSRGARFAGWVGARFALREAVSRAGSRLWGAWGCYGCFCTPAPLVYRTRCRSDWMGGFVRLHALHQMLADGHHLLIAQSHA